MTVRFRDLSVTWFGYATSRIEAGNGTVVYLDPGRYGVLTGDWEPWSDDAHHPPGREYDARDGDLVLVTHDHHYDSGGIWRVAADDATVVVYESVDAAGIDRGVEPVADLPFDVRHVGYGDELSAAGVSVEVVPAYNRRDGPRADEDGNVSHPRGFGCGYRLALPGGSGATVFYPGDSDLLPEHDGVDADLLLPPISHRLTMGPGEAADLAERLQPDLVVPVHYDTFPALAADSRAFAAEVASRGIPVTLDGDDPDA
jgi:L-ascorbate metabolism protein UlaG (beta-lactamase superfamily)